MREKLPNGTLLDYGCLGALDVSHSVFHGSGSLGGDAG